MNPAKHATDRKCAPIYEIRIKNHVDCDWSKWFEGMSVILEDEGTTLLSGPVQDQSALYGVLKKIHQLGLQLISVNITQ